MSKFAKAKEEIHFYRGDKENGRVVLNRVFIGRKEKESFFLFGSSVHTGCEGFPFWSSQSI